MVAGLYPRVWVLEAGAGRCSFYRLQTKNGKAGAFPDIIK